MFLCFAKQGKLKQYLKILTEGTGDEVAAHFGQEAKFERLQIFCALAAFHTAEGRSQQDRSKRVEHFTRAAELLSSARQIDYEDQLPFLGLGELDLARVRKPSVLHGKLKWLALCTAHPPQCSNLTDSIPTRCCVHRVM